MIKHEVTVISVKERKKKKAMNTASKIVTGTSLVMIFWIVCSWIEVIIKHLQMGATYCDLNFFQILVNIL